jgi:hypothetical protein
MKGPYIHFTGFIGGSTERSVTVSIKRGTSSNDALLLLTKMIEAISEAGIEDENINSFNIIRSKTTMPGTLRGID